LRLAERTVGFLRARAGILAGVFAVVIAARQNQVGAVKSEMGLPKERCITCRPPVVRAGIEIPMDSPARNLDWDSWHKLRLGLLPVGTCD